MKAGFEVDSIHFKVIFKITEATFGLKQNKTEEKCKHTNKQTNKKQSVLHFFLFKEPGENILERIKDKTLKFAKNTHFSLNIAYID